MDVDITTLRWFQQVADGATVTEVSDLEQVSQSGVSRALARLESELEVPLLRKAGRTLRTTRAGATFKSYVDRLLHELDDGLAAVTELASPDEGTVSIGFQPSLGTWLVPDLVAGFRAEHRGVKYELHETRDAVVGRALTTGEVDVEITTLQPALDGVRWQPLLAQPLRLAVHHRHRLADRTSVSLTAVSRSRFVTLRPEYALRRRSEALCSRAGFVPTIAFEGDDLSTVTGFVAAGLGVAITPEPGREPASTVRYLQIEDDTAFREIGVAWATERRLLPAPERFRRYAIDQLSRNRPASAS